MASTFAVTGMSTNVFDFNMTLITTDQTSNFTIAILITRPDESYKTPNKVFFIRIRTSKKTKIVFVLSLSSNSCRVIPGHHYVEKLTWDRRGKNRRRSRINMIDTLNMSPIIRQTLINFGKKLLNVDLFRTKIHSINKFINKRKYLNVFGLMSKIAFCIIFTGAIFWVDVVKHLSTTHCRLLFCNGFSSNWI